MTILGISAFYHDAAAALIKDDEILAAAQEERFTRKKHDPAFPAHAIQFCLDFNGRTLADIDAVVFYDKPLLKFERLLETYYAYAPRGWRSFLTSIPVWVKEKLFLKKLILDSLEKIEPGCKKNIRLLFPEHHLSHAASAFYPSPFDEAAILTIDGVGEWATASIGYGKGNTIEIKKELRFPHSLGLLYSAFTYFLGFKVNSGEYKLMGLAPYGNPDSPEVKKYEEKIRTELIDLKDDGSLWLNQAYFNYAAGLKMIVEKKWENLFGFARRKPEAELEQHHCNLGLAIQRVTEDSVVRMAHTAQKITNSHNLCLAGGVALNCVANEKILRANIFEHIWIQPAAGDAGGALGAALAAQYMYFQKERISPRANRNSENKYGVAGVGDPQLRRNAPEAHEHLLGATPGRTPTVIFRNSSIKDDDLMRGSYLGPEFSDLDIAKTARKFNASYTHIPNTAEFFPRIAAYLADGNVVGWFQGRMEWGPRALGNRSILGDARNPDMQKRMNLKIKYRESFRPFAPSVRAEDAQDYFDAPYDSPYMLLTAPVQKKHRIELPPHFNQLPLKDKLYFSRSDIPAVTHLDFSARLQTVHQETNPRYHAVLTAFKQLTGYALLVNTSFNVRGEPIVCTPEDAYRCFMRTEMDYLVMNNFVFDKKNQPQWKESADFTKEFTLD